MKIYDNIKRIKNSAWLQEHAWWISAEYNENWQSYLGLKLYKKLFLLVMSLEKHVFSWITFLLLIIDNNIESKKSRLQ